MCKNICNKIVYDVTVPEWEIVGPHSTISSNSLLPGHKYSQSQITVCADDFLAHSLTVWTRSAAMCFRCSEFIGLVEAVWADISCCAEAATIQDVCLPDIKQKPDACRNEVIMVGLPSKCHITEIRGTCEGTIAPLAKHMTRLFNRSLMFTSRSCVYMRQMPVHSSKTENPEGKGAKGPKSKSSCRKSREKKGTPLSQQASPDE